MVEGLIPWEFQVPAGFTVRGYHSPPSGKPVIHFIHGNGFCGLTFAPLLAQFQHDFDLFISDGQGHGDSDAGDVYPGWNKSAENFERVWQHFSPMWEGVPKIALGHSYGAIMSTFMIAKNPDLFDVGILMDPVYTPPKLAGAMSAMSTLGLMKNMPLARQARIRSVSWASRQEAWDYFHQRGIFKNWQDECLNAYLDHALSTFKDGTMHLKCPARIEAAVFSAYANKLWGAIKSIKTPMTMLYGDKTYSFVHKSCSKLRKTNPYYDFIEMPGGHCFMQEWPKLTAQEIKQKLRFQLNNFV